MQVLERKVCTKTWLTNSWRALPTGNILTSALCLAVTQTLTQAALLLSESLWWAKFINSTLSREERDRFPWDFSGKATSLCASCCPPRQQASWAELKVYSEARWGCVPPHSCWHSPTLCPDQGPVILSLASSSHTVLSSVPLATDLPAHASCALRTRAPSWLTSFLPTYTPVLTFSQVDVPMGDTLEPWPHNSPLSSSLGPLTCSSTPTHPQSHPEPSQYPQYFSNSDTLSPSLTPLSRFLIQSPSAIFL